MNQLVTIGIVGDYNPQVISSHRLTDQALGHAAQALSIAVEPTWIPTPSLEGPFGVEVLGRFDGLWGAPGSPYLSMDGALAGIRFAREADRPFIAT